MQAAQSSKRLKLFDLFVRVGVLLAKKRILDEKSGILLAIYHLICGTNRRIFQLRRLVVIGCSFSSRLRAAILFWLLH